MLGKPAVGGTDIAEVIVPTVGRRTTPHPSKGFWQTHSWAALGSFERSVVLPTDVIATWRRLSLKAASCQLLYPRQRKPGRGLSISKRSKPKFWRRFIPSPEFFKLKRLMGRLNPGKQNQPPLWEKRNFILSGHLGVKSNSCQNKLPNNASC